MFKKYSISQGSEGEILITIEAKDMHKETDQLFKSLSRVIEGLRDLKDEQGEKLKDVTLQEVEYYGQIKCGLPQKI